MKTLVSLVSEQTIPNIELIKEFKDEILSYIFISTSKMKKQLQWIINTTNISNKNIDIIEVNPFDIKDIENKLIEYPFKESEYYVNITGGTKLMTIIIEDFFRNLGAKIFYVTGFQKQYVKVFPNLGERVKTLTKQLTLDEYISGYGFNIEKGHLYKTEKEANDFFNYFINKPYDSFKPILSKLQQRRKKNTQIDTISGLDVFLNNINYNLTDPVKLNKYDAQYLTGNWFEEYVYYKVKKELNLNDNEIGIGYKITKDDVPNELDILFIHNHKLYIIECKTSFRFKQSVLIEKNGKKEEKIKSKNLLSEIIYKSDALRTRLGLFANTSVFTLSPIKDEKGEIFHELLPHIKRAELSRIKIVSKKDILENVDIKRLLSIK